MSGDINNVVFQGHMTADPKFFPVNGVDGEPHDKDRCWVVICANPPTKNPNAKPVFMPCNAFGRRAQIMAHYGKKGKGWGVVGSLKTRREELADGSYKNYTEISVAQNIMGADAKDKKLDEPVAEKQVAKSEEPLDGTLDTAADHLASLGYDAADIAELVAKKKAKEQSGDAPF